MQDRSMATSGMCGMAKRAHDRYAGRGVFVDYEPWKSDWKTTAEWIYRWSGYDRREPGSEMKPPTIMVVAYSWGAGWGLRQLAAHLAYRNLKIKVAVVSDAVHHVGWSVFHTVGISQVLAYMPWWRIKRPPSIEEFHWFVQSRNRGCSEMWEDFWNRSTLLYGHPSIQRDAVGRWHKCFKGTGVPLANHSNIGRMPAVS